MYIKCFWYCFPWYLSTFEVNTENGDYSLGINCKKIRRLKILSSYNQVQKIIGKAPCMVSDDYFYEVYYNLFGACYNAVLS